MTRKEIIQIIFNAIDELNQELAEEKHVLKSEDTVLFGKSSSLNSLGLVNLIMLTEELLEEEAGVSLTLGDEKAMSQKQSPFKTVSSFADHISTLLLKQGSQ